MCIRNRIIQQDKSQHINYYIQFFLSPIMKERYSTLSAIVLPSSRNILVAPRRDEKNATEVMINN